MDARNLSAPHSSFNNAGGNINNVLYYIFPPPENADRGPLSFIDAPVDLLTIHWTGRLEELMLVRDSLQVDLGDVPVRLIVYGMRGVGKSQLTLQFAKLAFDAHQYSVVFWISATTVEKLNQGFAKLLDLVHHPDRSHPAQITRLTVARRWLEEFNAGRWLLVLDDVESETISFLREHLPRKNGRGHILVTTRDRSVAETLANVAGQPHQTFELLIPPKREAANLLLNHTNEREEDAEHVKKAEKVAKCVGYLPLAVAQAGLFMKQSGKTLDEMLALYRSRHMIEIIRWENNRLTYQEKSVAATFVSQLKNLELQFPDFNNLLTSMAFLDSDSISIEMMVKGAENLSHPSPSNSSLPGSSAPSQSVQSLLALIQSPVALPSAIDELQNRSLVKRNPKASTLHIHSLIQFIIRDHANKRGVENQWFDFTVSLVCGAFQLVSDPFAPDSWNQCEMLIPHIQSLTVLGETHEGENLHIALLRANERVVGYFHVRKRYDEAESLLKRLLGWKSRRFGPDDDETLASRHELGRIYHSQRRYTEAEEQYERVRSIWEQRLAPDHPQVLEILGSLASVLDAQGRYGDAERLYNRIIAGREGQNGIDGMETSIVVVQLATVYKSQGRYTEAIDSFTRVLDVWKIRLGVDHHWTQFTMNGLAEVHYLNRQLDKAQELYEQVLDSQEKKLGIEHPDTLLTAKNLAAVYLSQGSFTEALPIYNRLLPLWERQFGAQHPDTLTIAANLAAVFDSQGWFDEAVALYEQVLANWEKLLGIEHPETLKTMRSLAGVYRSLGRHDESEKMYERVLKMQERILGPHHPETLATSNNLASMYQAQNRFDEAEKMFRSVLDAQKRVIGLHHPDTLATMDSLAVLYRAQGRNEEAEEMSMRTVAESVS